jgi:hypothetical protein
MKNRLLTIFSLLLFMTGAHAQQLNSFTAIMRPDGKSYLSISKKQVYTETEAADTKASIDFALIFTKDAVSPKLEWYNLSGTEDKIPVNLTGTASRITAISFDREQFDKCKTAGDFTRMTGHITANSFSHYAVISHTKDVLNQHCFIAESTNGKRALVWISKEPNNSYKVEVIQ